MSSITKSPGADVAHGTDFAKAGGLRSQSNRASTEIKDLRFYWSPGGSVERFGAWEVWA